MTTPLSPKGSGTPRKRPLHPFPDAVTQGEGDQWEVHRPLFGKLPATDMDNRKMYVPDGDTEEDKGIRLHEMLHVKLTDSPVMKKALKKAKVPMAYHVAEDIRIGYYAREWGFDTVGASPLEDCEKLLKASIASGRASDVVTSIMALAYSRTPSQLRDLRRGLSPQPTDPIVQSAITNAEHLLDLSRLWFDRDKTCKGFTLKLGKEVEKLCIALDEKQELEHKKEETREDGSDPGRMIEAAERIGTKKVLKMVKEIEGEEEQINKDPFKIPKPINTYGRKTIMLTEVPPLVHRIRVRGEAFAKSSAEEGTVPTRMTNFCSSGRVFDRKARLKGGTIVLDGSGSMAITETMVQSLVDAAPAATIAVYWGGHSNFSGYPSATRPYHGVLRVLVKNGITVDRKWMRSEGQGNTVDIPALQWALAQKGPRYWISDGQVCGSLEYENEEEIRVCMKLCKTGNIKRFDNIRDAVEHILGQDKDNEKVHLRGEGIGEYA